MIRVIRFVSGKKTYLSGGEELLNDWQTNGDDVVWVDFDQEDKRRERAIMEQLFQINSLAIDDAQRDRHPPKLEWFDNCFFLLLKGFTADTDSIDFSIVHISIFVGRNFLVTRHAMISPSIEIVLQQINDKEIDFSKGSAHLCYRIVRTIVDRYTPIILALESRLDQMEEQMLEDPNDTLLSELVSYNSQLKKLRRIFGYQQSTLAQLPGSNSALIGKQSRHEFQDAFEQMERLASLSSLLQELTRDLIDGYISISSHRLNNIMKLLTIASVIFLPLTFIAGIYGMNFENMPELSTAHGYFVVIGVLVFIAGGLLFAFRKMRWI
ncbi:MAG: magnesium/cobalt transporter CorA [Gammaproteobacteria bacterium]|nr:magnesium/cobalt transporter CorA [Gammaproteobacteria bacterium]MDH4315458.1 magnesium/cobalt transporter CorA [Gammaproteobacteria bacterium]MDH5214283.1 magnesium/cobalt transporter CorA [Gammaproteobacteria bacterium]